MTNYIANDTISGLPQVGSDIGGFLTGLAPGVGIFLLIVGLFSGITAIVAAIAHFIREKIVL